jgi:hypothetical protein
MKYGIILLPLRCDLGGILANKWQIIRCEVSGVMMANVIMKANIALD